MTDPIVDRIMRRIVEAIHPEKIILFEHPDFSMDVFVLSPDEIERQRHVANTLAREISETGVVLYAGS